MSYYDLSHTTTCGYTALALKNILSIKVKGGRQLINQPDILKHLNNQRLVTVEFTPYDWWEESHIFTCLRENNQYHILDSYVHKKEFEIRTMNEESFCQFLTLVSPYPSHEQWCEITNLPYSSKLNISHRYKITICSLPFSQTSFKNLCVLV